MYHGKRKKQTARLFSAVLIAVLLLPLLPLTASARENGRTVLTEDYYGLCDGNAVKVPGLTYRCSGHGDKMVPYYVEEENDFIRTIPGIIERSGDKVRYIQAYYCPSCYGTWKDGAKWDGEGVVYNDGSSAGKSLEDYMEFISENSIADMASYGYYYPPKDDFEHIPKTSGNGVGGNTYALPDATVTDETILAGLLHSNKALPEPIAKQPDTDAPEGNRDVLGAWTFYQFYYTGMRKIVNKPSSADDPAWDTVKDTTRIYYMQRQADNQTYACRIDWYNYDDSKLADWRITDLMAEYKTGEICGYATYVGKESEVAVPEKINIPLCGVAFYIGGIGRKLPASRDKERRNKREKFGAQRQRTCRLYKRTYRLRIGCLPFFRSRLADPLRCNRRSKCREYSLRDRTD